MMEYVTLKKFAAIPSIAVCLLGISLQASATPYTVCGGPGRPVCVDPVVGPKVPPPRKVPGKELSTHRDRDAANVRDPEQNIAWDGIGGTADTFDYSGSRMLAGGLIDQDREVDALANSGDVLYQAVIGNLAALLFSVDDDPNIYLETTRGAFGVWADQSISTPDGAPGSAIDNMYPIRDVDGLEVWGPDGPDGDDADNYSLEGDVGAPDPNGVAVWSYSGGVGGISTVNWLASEIADIVSDVTGFSTSILQDLNLDAMMTNDPNQIMFSVDPLAGLLDGGEIFVGVRGGGGTYLNHGGHLWNTAFDVRGTFGLGSENINALEAVAPAPGSLALISLGGALLLLRRRRRVS